MHVIWLRRRIAEVNEKRLFRYSYQFSEGLEE